MQEPTVRIWLRPDAYISKIMTMGFHTAQNCAIDRFGNVMLPCLYLFVRYQVNHPCTHSEQIIGVE